ncbi:hypothetical protein SEA_STCROIX_2 [Rhodococcus phage StCroix]|uniref:Uncharacterized protein n=1 Tax=Rhodococcus phage Krishelle TaxID=2015829 RepID=A0A222ZIY8_9CAUD|nr:hypothetical protein SEA_STCROIX_2 [Rhodococcus phage StCroix]ASR84378.1 hypothetical protein SEA_NAIAD_2 [Rhodococcus phage Naiad]ASR84385.1 hypothetical protein SEA_KRISHELLE_2 [Rhodococcus phage Krishelle]AWY04017.1 hypothetical protein SEA_SHUMAN_2 [Rhodococcus phage Shuman]AWY05572.1 hypothetical protein PBI_NANCINATOR_2 [Rhodococcus phage Nancinator]AWY06203.1 hypothetical protein PBI_SWANN_2 [Rhodococcus phage Swann]AWY06633.1 hypothetical protein SEA_UHSALSA_2 [Rhodococcus phage Uh
MAMRADGSQIGRRVVIAWVDVVNLGCGCGATGQPDLASPTIPREDRSANGVPVGW